MDRKSRQTMRNEQNYVARAFALLSIFDKHRTILRAAVAATAAAATATAVAAAAAIAHGVI